MDGLGIKRELSNTEIGLPPKTTAYGPRCWCRPTPDNNPPTEMPPIIQSIAPVAKASQHRIHVVIGPLGKPLGRGRLFDRDDLEAGRFSRWQGMQLSVCVIVVV